MQAGQHRGQRRDHHGHAETSMKLHQHSAANPTPARRADPAADTTGLAHNPFNFHHRSQQPEAAAGGQAAGRGRRPIRVRPAVRCGPANPPRKTRRSRNRHSRARHPLVVLSAGGGGPVSGRRRQPRICAWALHDRLRCHTAGLAEIGRGVSGLALAP